MGLRENIFSIVYDEISLSKINPFYAEVLRAWDFVTDSRRELLTEHGLIMSQPLFRNPHVQYQGKLLYFKFFVDCV